MRKNTARNTNARLLLTIGRSYVCSKWMMYQSEIDLRFAN